MKKTKRTQVTASRYARMRAALVAIHEHERVLRDFQVSEYAQKRLESIRVIIRDVLGNYSLADAEEWKELGRLGDEQDL